MARSNAVWALPFYLSAGILLVAAYSKLSTSAPSELDGAYSTLIQTFLATFTPVAELILALVFVFGWRSRRIAILGASVFAFFSMLNLTSFALGQENCGCFGTTHVSPLVIFSVDLLLTSVFLVVALTREGSKSVGAHTLTQAPTIVLLGTMLALAITLNLGISKIWAQSTSQLLFPEDWIGKQFPLVETAELPSEIQQGKWLVLIYREGCPACERSLRHLGELSMAKLVIELASEPDVSHTAMTRYDDLLWVSVPEGKSWVMETPVAIELQGGVVRAVHAGHGLESM